jgi:hypothetical protein
MVFIIRTAAFRKGTPKIILYIGPSLLLLYFQLKSTLEMNSDGRASPRLPRSQ